MNLAPNKYLLWLLLWLSAVSLAAQCPSGFTEVRIQIVPDQYPGETTWSLKTLSGTLLDSGLVAGDTVCVPAQTCIVFSIYDSYGDGICCLYGLGSYTVHYGDTLVASGGQFEFKETAVMGCPPGAVCDEPLPVTTGSWTSIYEDTWYDFVPDSSGIYAIDVCQAVCGSALWVYESCPVFPPSDLQIGALLYGSGGCSGPGATTYATLVAGESYLIRIGDVAGGCAPDSLPWSLTYIGPVTGCTDPLACNYNPAATVSDTCIYPGDPACPVAPDLEVDQALVENSMYLDSLTILDPCLVEEACITGYGKRYILRFSTRISNIGTQDYFIGATPADPDSANEQFMWDPCHGHWHYAGYAEYLLFDTAGNPVPAGFKNGFCVLDLACAGGGTAKYSCGYMGISAGCEDIYDASLGCQWIDLTDVAEGDYTFVVRVNWDGSPDKLGYYESNYENNWAQVCLRITRPAGSTGAPLVEQLDSCATFTDCNGVTFGSAAPDCAGVCEGYALAGDLDADTLRDAADVDLYLTAALDGGVSPVVCTDLNADGVINVADAALAQDCAIRGAEFTGPFGGVEDHCEFPSYRSVLTDTATFSITAVDLVAGYADISVLNPATRIIGYQLALDGVQLDSVRNLVAYPGYSTDLRWRADGEIAALSPAEALIDRNYLPVPVLRAYFAPPAGSLTLCITAVPAVVSERYETVTGAAGDCFLAIGTGIADGLGPQVRVQPNPFSGMTVFTVTPAPARAYTLQVTDMEGRVVRSYENLTGDRFELSREGLSAGVYLYVCSGAVTARGKLVVW
ncbi:MAG: lysyl oxidase family protein [Bacteroidia bacterium]|nr:lysyl oxidase family protein [Bacteroidia bacterium]